MLKYVDTAITFSEFPDEISLCINISNCPHKCEGCHSPYLREDIGTPLTMEVVDKLIKENEGITCIGFMGGDNDWKSLDKLFELIKFAYPKLKIGWYSGSSGIPIQGEDMNLINLDYIKIGPYIKEKGPLNSKTTNQKMFQVLRKDLHMWSLKDITYKFQK